MITPVTTVIDIAVIGIINRTRSGVPIHGSRGTRATYKWKVRV